MYEAKVEMRDEIKQVDLSSLNPNQLEAAQKALDFPISIITGGPGVGKTFTARAVVDQLVAQGRKVALCAPTGKAAKRLSEVTYYEAKTIHRLLEPIINPATGEFMFQRGEQNKLNVDAVVVDETSMVDVNLMASLCKALPKNAKLIILGDVDQLPSVGPGNVLRDLIDSTRIPTTRLTQIVRQKEGSFIIQNAHAINKGIAPRRPPGSPPDRGNISDYTNFQPGQQAMDGSELDFTIIKEVREEKIVELCAALAHKFNAQVIVPMHKPMVGTRNLNKVIQSATNPMRGGMHPLEYGRGELEVQYREGDKVMNLKNDAQRGIYNGDIGVITEIVSRKGEESIKVRFEVIESATEIKQLEVAFSKQELIQIVHAYAITIHKSQGCEWEHVVIPLHTSHSIMLQRNLLYTAVTRAKKMCWLIGGEGALRTAVGRVESMRRRTMLKQFVECMV